MTEKVTLARGDTRLDVVPGIGGSVARWWTERDGRTYQWFRPASAADLAAGNPLGMGSFPLSPYSNRIRDGRFPFGGRTITLPLNFLPERHALHGHGWQCPWTVLERSGDMVEIGYEHPADEWPFAYAARQRIALVEDGLDMVIAIENRSPEPMPVGLGHHPYFVRTPESRVTAAVSQMWMNDAEVMPVAVMEPVPGRDPRHGLRPATDICDNCFLGWDRRALIEWPEWDAALEMTADHPLDFLVIYTPPGEDYFCVEPVSNSTDAFNMAAAGRGDTGTISLPPGATVEGRMRLVPRIGGAGLGG